MTSILNNIEDLDVIRPGSFTGLAALLLMPWYYMKHGDKKGRSLLVVARKSPASGAQ